MTTDTTPVTLTYTNWRGETAERTILPQRVWFGATEWHPEPQWLLRAIDTENGAERDFALKDFGHDAPRIAALEAEVDELTARAMVSVAELCRRNALIAAEQACVAVRDGVYDHLTAGRCAEDVYIAVIRSITIDGNGVLRPDAALAEKEGRL